MFNNRESSTNHNSPGAARYDAGHLFPRAPLLLLAVALMALAILLVHDSPTAQATHGSDAHLSGLTISGTIELDDETVVTVPLLSNPPFDPHTDTYTVRVPDGLKSITFTPTWGSGVDRVQLWDRLNSNKSTVRATDAGATRTSGSALTITSSRGFPAIRVIPTESGAEQGSHYFTLNEVSLAFDTTTVEARTYTAGHEISHLGLSEAETDALRLPKATGGFYNVTYEATGLPDGLWLGQGRLIQGTPTTKATTPAEVTYTATDDAGRSVSLMFNVNVAAPVEFSDAEDVRTFKNTIIEYTVGQSEPINLTLPEAKGGHGMLTYGLSYWVKETRTVDGRQVTAHWEYSINDDAPGFTFNKNGSRVLASNTGALAPSAKAFYSVDYWAEDENGARVIATNSITVNEAPTLPDTYRGYHQMRVGESVSVTLPEAEGGTRVGIGIRYDLGGVDLSPLGLSFNGRTRTISGTPVLNDELDLTYTATDRNGVTDSVFVQVDILPGPSVPTDVPVLTAFNAATESGRQIVFLDWADVERATSYVVQVIADGERFPTYPVSVLPEEASMTVYDSQTDLGNDKTGHALITGLAAGDYTVTVTAKNADGVGPWSNNVIFTVPVGGL